MNNKVIVPLDVIDEDELNEFIDRIEALTHADVKIERQFVLSSDNPAIMSGLESLFGNILKNQNQPAKKSGRQLKAVSQAAMGCASQKIEATGEIISLVKLKKRIADGMIADQTIVTNHKGERFVVIGDDLIKEPQQ